MDNIDMMARLRELEPELRAKGVGALYLFGSRARGDHRPDSDVDLAFDVTAAAEPRFSLLKQAHLLGRLEEKLGTHVDLVPWRSLRPRIRARFDHDAVQLFG